MTEFTATATRVGSWWEITIAGLPDTMVGVSQARRLTEVKSVARTLVAELLDVDPKEISIRVEVDVPDELRAQIDDFHRAGEVAERVRAETATARSRAAVALIESGLTLREAAAILDISHQRVKQLVDHATTT